MKLVATGHSAERESVPDWSALRRSILDRLMIEKEFEELGVSYTGPPDAKGWRTCWAVDRPETNPSAGVHGKLGLYHDFGTGETLDLFRAALKWQPTRFGRWIDALRYYAERAGVRIGAVPTGKQGRIREAQYLYHQADGAVAYAVFRYRLPNGEKTFSQHPPDGSGGWKFGRGAMDGVAPVPYRLPQLLARPGTQVLIVEGEKDCDRAAELGLVATTNHGGAHAAARTWPHFIAYFRDRDCVILPDNDEPGRNHAIQVAGLLWEVARSIRIVELPGLAAKGDLSDWLDAGGTREELAELIARSEPIDAEFLERETARRRVGSREGNGQRDPVSVEEEWSPPRLNPVPEVPPFPLEVLPVRLAELCREASMSFSCPVDYFAAAAVALAGGVIGQSVALAIKRQWVENPNLYLAIVGAPGTRKTPALKLMARPLYRIDRQLRQIYLDEKKEWEENGKEGAAPVPGHLTIDDTTAEALALAHSENPRGLVVILDELSAWVAGLNAYRQGKGSDKQFWLKLNSGSSVKVTRKNNRESLIIPYPCVTVVGGLTPGMLPAIREGKADDGWLDRILFAYPKPVEFEVWQEHEVDPVLIDDWSFAIERLWACRPQVDPDGHQRPRLVPLSDAARSVWIDWYNRHKREQRDINFDASLRGPWSKLEGFCGRLALIVSLLHQAYDPTIPHFNPGPLDELAVWGATQLVDYFKDHFRQARFDLTRKEEVPDDAQAMLKWFRACEIRGFSRRDARRNFERRFGQDEEALEEALRWLIVHHCVRPRTDPRPEGPGRARSGDFLVNPALWSPVPPPKDDGTGEEEQG